MSKKVKSPKAKPLSIAPSKRISNIRPLSEAPKSKSAASTTTVDSTIALELKNINAPTSAVPKSGIEVKLPATPANVAVDIPSEIPAEKKPEGQISSETLPSRRASDIFQRPLDRRLRFDAPIPAAKLEKAPPGTRTKMLKLIYDHKAEVQKSRKRNYFIRLAMVAAIVIGSLILVNKAWQLMVFTSTKTAELINVQDWWQNVAGRGNHSTPKNTYRPSQPAPRAVAPRAAAPAVNPWRPATPAQTTPVRNVQAPRTAAKQPVRKAVSKPAVIKKAPVKKASNQYQRRPAPKKPYQSSYTRKPSRSYAKPKARPAQRRVIEQEEEIGRIVPKSSFASDFDESGI